MHQAGGNLCLYSMTTDGFLGPQQLVPLHAGIRCLVRVSSSASTTLGREVLQGRRESSGRQHFRPGDRVRLNDFQESLGSKVESQLVILGFSSEQGFDLDFISQFLLFRFVFVMNQRNGICSNWSITSRIKQSLQHPPYQLSLAVFAQAREAHIRGRSAPRSSSRPFVEKVPMFANLGSLSPSQPSALSSCGLAGMNQEAFVS